MHGNCIIHSLLALETVNDFTECIVQYIVQEHAMLSASAHLCVILDNVQHALWLLWTLPHPRHTRTHPVNPQALDHRIYLLRSYYRSLALTLNCAVVSLCP